MLGAANIYRREREREFVEMQQRRQKTTREGLPEMAGKTARGKLLVSADVVNDTASNGHS